MKEITINELQADTAAWVRQAALEKQIIITEQGRPVATLLPLPTLRAGQPLPNREAQILARPFINHDSGEYISEMREDSV